MSNKPTDAIVLKIGQVWEYEAEATVFLRREITSVTDHEIIYLLKEDGSVITETGMDRDEFVRTLKDHHARLVLPPAQADPSAAEAEISRLKAELSEAQSIKADKLQLMNERDDAVAIANREAESRNREMQRWFQQKESLEAEIQRLTLALSNAQARTAARETEVDGLAAEVEALKIERDEAKATYRCFNCDFATSDTAEAEAHFGEGEGEQSLCLYWGELCEKDRLDEFQSTLQQLNCERDESGRLMAERADARKEVEQERANSFAAQEQLSRALVAKKQAEERMVAVRELWLELVKATGAGRHLSTTTAIHQATLKWIADVARVGEAVKTRAVEIADNYSKSRPDWYLAAISIRNMIGSIDLSALLAPIAADEKGEAKLCCTECGESSPTNLSHLWPNAEADQYKCKTCGVVFRITASAITFEQEETAIMASVAEDEKEGGSDGRN